ncbi:hypothetical protein CAPTEDRAFT_219223 [Capitella teleta]|uniref:Ionotropic glutamate receptor C-terminal domain-containing protein n=1 Tax=Capitella teleta TaxID=283909 RepID=R7TXL9_CAPTE|nr:hypothetical protein CAPTEDRAFT_219223 [Capitella teleta]|eukprot:ELT98317.1 hypothetical protein CAPTEDRAFT_219223 [Capitella teleta]
MEIEIPGNSVFGFFECVDNLKSMPQYKKLTLITIGPTCAPHELREAFSKINLRQASSVLVSIRGHCVQTFLDEVNSFDKEIGQHGYFTFLYQWVVFTDHVSRDIIEKHTKRIINIAFVTHKSHGCNEVQSVIRSNLQPTLVQSTWPLQSLNDLFPAKKFGLNGVQLRIAVNVLYFCGTCRWRLGRKRPEWDMEWISWSNAEEGSPRSPRSCSGRMLAAFWWFFAITVAAVYSGNLTASLAVTKLNIPYKTFADLAQQNVFKLGILGGTSDVEFFKDVKQEPYKTIGRKIFTAYKSDSNVMSRDVDVHLRLIRNGGYVYIGDSALLDPLKDCVITTENSDGQLQYHYSVILQKNSALTPFVNDALIKCLETGILDRLESRYLPHQPPACAAFTKPDAVKVDLASFAAIAFLLTVLVLLLENLMFRMRKKL